MATKTAWTTPVGFILKYVGCIFLLAGIILFFSPVIWGVTIGIPGLTMLIAGGIMGSPGAAEQLPNTRFKGDIYHQWWYGVAFFSKLGLMFLLILGIIFGGVFLSNIVLSSVT